MKRVLSIRSERNLVGVNKTLVSIVKQALQDCECDFTVVDGVRTLKRQQQLIAEGKSKKLNSYHIPNEFGGRAVDLYPFYNKKVQVNAPKEYWQYIADAMKSSARDHNAKITWGGDWKTLVDKPHFQIEL